MNLHAPNVMPFLTSGRVGHPKTLVSTRPLALSLHPKLGLKKSSSPAAHSSPFQKKGGDRRPLTSVSRPNMSV